MTGPCPWTLQHAFVYQQAIQDPKILAIPTTAWINQPADNSQIELAA